MSVFKKGTVSVTNGSATVTGTGTNWLGQIAPGQVFALVGEVSYTIASVASDTSLTLTAPYGGTTKSGQTYSVTRDFTTGGLPLLAPGTVSASGVLNPVVQALEDGVDNRLIAQSPGDVAGTAATQPTSRFPYVVGSVAELRAIGPGVAKAGQTVSTKGYYADGDGGSNDYVIELLDGSADDGGSVIFLDDGVHHARGLFSSREVNIRQFGAVGDGNTDDISAIQAAINSTPVTGFFSGSEVQFPGGYYRISAPIIIPHENIYLRGAGADVTVIRATEDFPLNEFIIRATPSANDLNPLRRWGVSRMMIDGRNQADGIGAVNAALIDFDRLIIRGVRDGITISATEKPSDVTVFQPGGPYITNCRFNASRTQIRLVFITQVWILENWFVGSEQHIVVDKGDKVKIIGNEFNNWSGSAAVLLTSDDPTFRCEKISVIGNQFFNSGNAAAVKEQGECMYNNVQSNSAWAGELFERVSSTSLFGNNQGTTVDMHDVVDKQETASSGYRKFSNGWAEAWVSAEVDSESTLAQDISLPVTFLTTTTQRAGAFLSPQSADAGSMNATNSASVACLGSSVRVRFSAAQGAGVVLVRINVAGFTQ